MKYLPDTNTFILGFKKSKYETLFLQQFANEIAISVVVIGEFYPKASKQDLKAIELLYNKLPILTVDLDIALQAGRYRKMQFKKQSRSYLNDCFLAAQANIHDLVLVTNNKKDFNFKDIKVVSPRELI